MNIKNNKMSQTIILLDNNDLSEIMKQSFEFWHKKYNNSPLNYPLVWKKALKSDSEIIKKIELLKKNTNYNTEIIIEEFFEMWSYAIKEHNFEIAKKSIQEYEEFWKNATDEQFRMCSEILQMIERYWREIQSKNIE